ncbi:mitochondrial-processing peptidase subunit beta-like [Frieseomelitta varia]|uniref:mitochondrial-processing peptidase subunit beta-like n=1 Tax=Frieseomelitta varia TaxID=561572 RepID=UPI001CB69BC3|nr:mitochondrial-processing peptidase subunit beta-like [Frieseomelitta varia]
MIAFPKYLSQMQSNTIYKYIKRGFVSISNKQYKAHQDFKGISRKINKASSTYFDIESSTESCYMSNGMRLICEHRNSFTTTVGCFVPAGAMYETQNERGSALFLEHLFFRKTKCYDKEQMECIIEEIGGNVTALAMRDLFLFYGTVVSCKVDKIIQLFANIILNGVICDKDVTQEKVVILEKLSEMESDREKIVMDYLPTIAYQGTALGNSVYPETDTIKKFSTKNLFEFHHRLFQTCYMTMVCTGSICLKELQRIVCKHFNCNVEDYKSSFGVSNNLRFCKNIIEYRFSAAELRFRDDDNELGYAAIGFEGSNYKEREDRITLTVAKEIIGSWNVTSGGVNHNAPFIAHFAYNTDLCYMYKSFFHHWAQSTSIWGCYFVCDYSTLLYMVRSLQKEWMKLCTVITEKEVSRAVHQCITKDLLILNNPENRFLDIVENVFRCGYYEPVEHRVVEYEKVTADKIREVSDKYIYYQSPVVVALGRIEGFPDYITLKSGLYLLRY